MWGGSFPAVLVLAVLATTGVAAQDSPRISLRGDLALLAAPNVGANGGGGVLIPTGGTGAGLAGGFGAEVGIEVRIGTGVWLEFAFGSFRTEVEVGRDRGPDVRGDFRSAPIDLGMLTFGVVVRPPSWQIDRVRFGIGALAARGRIGVSPDRLGVAIEDGGTAFGGDLRCEFDVGVAGGWGFGVRLAFVNVEPSFADVETGASGSLQVSPLFLTLGARWTR